MSNSDWSGLEELQKKMNKLSKTNDVSFAELFNSKFMRRYTEFSTFEELLEKGGFEVESEEDFEAIPEDDFDLHISKHTSFSSWEEMLSTAGQEWLKDQIDL